MKRFFILIFAFCGISAAAQEEIVFMPQWKAQAQFAGYYVAKEKGFYADEGLEVTINHPSALQSAMSRLRSGECQATTLTLCQALEVVDGGLPLVNILQTSMNNALVIISSRGAAPLTQKGAKVGFYPGFGQLAVCMSIQENLDYEWIPLAQGVNLFIAGALDAIACMSYNEYCQFVQAGLEMDESIVYRFCNHGYNVQEDGLYMTRDYCLKYPERARKFANASRKGWEWAARNPEEALDIVMSYVERDHIATNRTMQRMMLGDVLRLQLDRESGEREFRLREDMVELAVGMLFGNKMLGREVKYEELVR